jgi:predicted adenylyl cyclase CyaB
MIEVEIKVQISDPTLIRKKFVENQGSYKFSLIHEDTYFNMPKGLRDFKQTDEALRLRK